MAQSRVFTILGDSNVKKNVTKTNTRACPSLAGSQVLQCQKLQLFEDALSQVRAESTVCMISCITNFLTDSDDEPTLSKRIEPVLDDFCAILFSFCSAHPDLAVCVAPPMYRRSPLWYRDGLPEILTKFSSSFKEKPVNVNLMSSFPTPEFEADGVHLTAYCGLEFILHLFDSANSILDGQNATCDERIPEASEVTRLLEDRVMVLEQDHRRLNSDFELKTAADAEIHDFHWNVSNEAFLVITGCQRLLRLGTKEWQDRARAEVAPILKELMGRDIPIEYITNSTGPQPNALVRYNVKLFSTSIAKEVRTKFGTFYPNGRDERPPFFKPFTIRNLITQGTRIRLAVLQVIGRRYKDANKGSKVQVKTFFANFT